jgi:hypothetical protein
LFSSATLLLELAAPLMIVGGAINIPVALGLLAMHLNILVLTHILYWQAMVFLVLFGLLPREPTPAVASGRPVLLLQRRPFVVGSALLIVCAMISIEHQSRRFTLWHDAGAVRKSSPAAVEAAPPVVAARPDLSNEAFRMAGDRHRGPATPLQQVGPFTVGQTLTAGWRLDALELTDDGFVAMVLGEAGRVRFEVTCSPSQHRSPFDLDAAHIFYSPSVEFQDLEAVGWALRERLREVGEEQVLCDRLEEWVTAARVGRPH